MKKKGFVSLVFMLFFLTAAVFSGKEAKADSLCDHRDPTQFDFRNDPAADHGIATYGKCGICGEWYPYCLYHSWEQKDIADEPTCTTDAYYVIECRHCHARYTEVTEKAYGHAWSEWWRILDPSCVAEGKEARQCSRCHETEYRVLEKTDHDWVQVAAYNTTCTADGYYVLQCRVCYARREVMTDKAYGHRFGEWHVTKEASCAAEGEMHRECEECHLTETKTIPKTDHTWGSWYVKKEAAHGQPGTEERHCVICMTTETRTLAPAPPEAKVGDESIQVVVAQEMLKYGGEYAGVCDGVFRDDLAAAVKAYEKAAGLPETGVIYKDTLDMLSERFMTGEDFEIPYLDISGRTVHVFPDSGLKTDARPYVGYISNQDGTHVAVNPTVVGFDYAWKDQTFSVTFAGEYEQEPYTEPCSPMNGSLECEHCHYILPEGLLTIEAVLPDLDAYFSENGGFTLTCNLHPEDLTHYDLPQVEGLCYNAGLNMLEWDPFDGALRCDVYLWPMDPDSGEHGELLVEDCIDGANSYAFPALEAGHYLAAVLAKDDWGAVSDHTMLYFNVIGDRMPDPLEVELKDGCASWAYEYGDLDPIFHVTLIRYDEGLFPYYEADTKNAYLDLTSVYLEIVKKNPTENAPYSVIVQARDANGILKDSHEVESPQVPWETPNFYKVLCAVNVRLGPGKEFERIGGYKKGSIIVSFDTESGYDGTYVVVNFKGQTGYVLASCLSWFAPKSFKGHIDLGNGKSVDVVTNPDGTINQEDLANKVTKLGYVLTGLKRTGGSGEMLQDDEVIEPGERFEAVWEPDPNYVIIQLVDQFDHPVEVIDYRSEPFVKTSKIAVPVGGTFRLRTASITAAGWTVVSGGSELTVTDETVFTPEMTKIVCRTRLNETVKIGVMERWPQAIRSLYLTDSKPVNAWTELAAYAAAHPENTALLETGDMVTILGEEPETSGEEKTADGLIRQFYRVRVERLNKEGYIAAILLDKMSKDRYMVWFDANGGVCPVGGLLAQTQKGYAYPTIAKLPTASRSGYYFAGWVDENGKAVREGHEFTGRTDLKAVWIKYTGYTVKDGLTVTRGGGPVEEQEQPYGLETPASSKKIPLPVCEELRVIGETADMYECLLQDHRAVWVDKRFIVTDYETVFDRFLPRLNNYYLYYDHYDEEQTWRESAGYIGHVSEQSYLGTRFYIIGHRGAMTKIAMPVTLANNKQDERPGGTGWIYDDTYSRADTSCTVSFCPGEGVCWLDKVSVEFGKTVGDVSAFPVPCLSGYEFVGWYTDPYLGEWFHSGTKVTESLTVYAHYKNLYDDLEAATETAPIYDRCSTSKGEILGYVNAGEVVFIQKESKQGLFGYVSHKGISGWVQMRYLKAGTVRAVIADRKTDMAIRSEAKYRKGKVYRDIIQAELFLDIGSKDSYEKIAYPCKDGYAYIAKDQFR